MERIFWVECPECHGRFFCDYELRFSELKLHCPFCGELFEPEQSPWRDERG